MKKISLAFLLFLATLLLSVWSAQPQPLELVEGTLMAQDGTPLGNRMVVIEGAKTMSWLAEKLRLTRAEKVSVISITDSRGFFQVVDLPAGNYTLKLAQPGSEPVFIREFKLESGYAKRELNTKVESKYLPRPFSYDRSIRESP